LDKLRFAWDPSKASANLRKHGVSFEEAETVFADDNALLLDDPAHSRDEDRAVLLGPAPGSASSWCATPLAMVVGRFGSSRHGGRRDESATSTWIK
jgi:uncharacterized DUF497 family protein